MNSIFKRTSLWLALLLQVPILFYSQNIPQTVTLAAPTVHGFVLEKDQWSLANLSANSASPNKVYYYNGGAGYNNHFLAGYQRYKFLHPGIANSDIISVSYSFNYSAYCDPNHPTQYSWWSQSQMFVMIPQSSCANSYWGSYNTSDCSNTESCITGGQLLATIGQGLPACTTNVTQNQSITGSNLSYLLQNPNDFSIAFWPNGGSTCYIDIKTQVTANVTYNTYPIGNNNISANQTFVVSGNPVLLTGTTPTGGNKGIFTYQWQSSINNSTWTNITGATAATYDPPTLTQTTYYRRIVSSSPQPPSISNTITITINPPASPAGVTLSPQSTTSLLLSWSASASATSYSVYTCAGAYVGSVNAPSTSYVINGLNPGTSYQYYVVSGAGILVSPPSACASGSTYPPVTNNVICCDQIHTGSMPTTAFSGSLPTGGNGVYTYNWQSSPDNINWTNAGITTQNYSTPPTVLSTTYYRRVVTSQSVVYNSNVVIVTVNAPATPLGLNLSPQSTTSLLLSWGAASGAIGYNIYDCVTNALITSVNAPSTSYVINGLNPGTSYQYYVVSTAGTLVSPPSTCASGSTYPPVTNNVICCDQTHTGSMPTTALSGSLPTGGNGVYTYDWQSSTDNINWTSTGVTTQNYSSPPVVLNTTYYRRVVTAQSVVYNSNVVTIIVSPPATPTGVSLSPQSTTSILMSWNASTGATGYNIYDCVTNVLVATVNAPATSYLINGLNPYTYYQYYIVAICGPNNPSAPSPCVTTTTFDSQMQTSTFAGSGSNVYSGNGGPAQSAGIPLTTGIAKDAAGNIYLLHGGSANVIRKISTSGIISVFAGNGTNGNSGDNGPATSASFYASSMIQDAAGNFYISDAMHHVIRKINTSGIITTIAGDGTNGFSGDGFQAAGAKLAAPSDMAFDAAGNFYFIDYARIRMISPAGIITTIAGNGIIGYNGDNGPALSARINPAELELDGTGNLFFTDHNHHVIRKINSGIITTYAGIGIAGYSGDNGPATAAKLHDPIGLTIDNNNNMYVADVNNQVIRKINNAGMIKTIAGTGAGGFSGDGGLSTAAKFYNPWLLCSINTTLYVWDFANNRLRVIYDKCYSTPDPYFTNQKVCCGSTCNSVLIGSPALAGLTYAWYPSTGLDCSNCAQPNASPCYVGNNTNYQLTVSGPYCTTTTSIVTVHSNNSLGNCCRIAQPNETAGISPEKGSYLLFPNPSSKEISITSDDSIEMIRIMDVSGKIVFELKNPGSDIVTIDVSKYSKGIYFAEVQINGKVQNNKFIVE